MKLAAGVYESEHPPNIRLSITDVAARTGRLEAWVEVFAGPRRLTYGDLNLRGARTVATLTRSCQEAAPGLKVDWNGFLTEALYEVIHDVLEGDPPVELTAKDATPPGWIVDTLIGDVGATSLVGYGQTGKSMIALAAALTVASGDDVWLGLPACDEGPVFYLDYEGTRETHEWRVAQLCAGNNNRRVPSGLYYRRESIPLYRAVTSISRHAHKAGAKLLIVDSVMLARGGGDTFGHEGTISLYAALAQIGIPALLIDHRAKNTEKEGPWGSVINLNSLRLAFGVTTAVAAEGIDVTLKKIKANYHGRVPDHRWRLLFADSNRSARFDPITEPTGDGSQSMKDRIIGLLRRAGVEGWTAKGLATEVGVSDNTMRAHLSQLKRQGAADQVLGRWLAEGQDDQEEAPF